MNSEKAWVFLAHLPTNIYLLEVNNRNTRKRCEICSKLTIKTPELLFLLLTLNIIHFLFYCFYCWLWKRRRKRLVAWTRFIYGNKCDWVIKLGKHFQNFWQSYLFNWPHWPIPAYRLSLSADVINNVSVLKAYSKVWDNFWQIKTI